MQIRLNSFYGKIIEFIEKNPAKLKTRCHRNRAVNPDGDELDLEYPKKIRRD